MKSLYRVYLVIFLITMSKGTINVVFPPYLESKAYLVGQIGLLTSLFAVFQLVARLPSGILYSPKNARMTLIAGLAALGLSALGFAVSDQTVVLVVLIVLNGFAFGAITTVALALAIDAKPAEYPSGAMMGWYTGAIAAGYSVGQPVGGFLADNYGFGGAFASTVAFSLLAILIILSLRGLGQPVSSSKVQRSGSRPFKRWSLRGLDLRKIPEGVLLATVIVFFLNLMFRSLHTFFPLYALAVGITLSQIGLLRSMLSLTAASVRPFSGKLFSALDHRRVTHLAMLVGAGAVMLTTVVPSSMVALSLLFLLLGLSRGLLRVTSATFLAESNDQGEGRNIGLWSGVYNSGLDMGSIVGPIVGGFLASLIGIPSMLVVMALMALFAYGLISLFVRRKRTHIAAAPTD